MKTATVSTRIDNGVKTEAEEILKKLGIPVSVLINSLYHQIIFQKGIPFSLTIPSEPKTMDEMTETELNEKLEHSYRQSLDRQGKPFTEVFDALERGLQNEL